MEEDGIISQKGQMGRGNSSQKVEGRGKKFFISGSSGFYLNAPPAITKPKGKPLHV